MGADKTVSPQHPGNPLRSSQRNGSAHAAGIATDKTPALTINRPRPRVAPKTTAVGLCTAATMVHAVGTGGRTQHRWRGWREGHQQHMNVPPLPVVRPAPVAAAAGESPTASAPLPAVYGYTPEQRVGTERQESGTRKERFTEPVRVGAPEQLER